jgi:hypothetical protein
MTKDQLIQSFSALGTRINNLGESEKEKLFVRVGNENPWFTHENLEKAFKGIGKWLNESSLREWMSKYPGLPTRIQKKVGLVLAGNIPMVGFHDVLCVLLSGHTAVTKLSSKDSVCMKFIREELLSLNPDFESRWQIVDLLKDIDAIIATGSDNSARYFQQYFSKYPHIIRKNRTSVAIISGFESDEELKALGEDIFSYFGLGCRNVTFLFLHENVDPADLLKIWEHYSPIKDHHKYINNYDYYRSIYLVNRQEHYASDFLMMKEEKQLFTPVANLNYMRYRDISEVEEFIKSHEEEIQCVVSSKPMNVPIVRPGNTQNPEIDDYADGVDTMKYLEELAYR